MGTDLLCGQVREPMVNSGADLVVDIHQLGFRAYFVDMRTGHELPGKGSLEVAYTQVGDATSAGKAQVKAVVTGEFYTDADVKMEAYKIYQLFQLRGN